MSLFFAPSVPSVPSVPSGVRVRVAVPRPVGVPVRATVALAVLLGGAAAPGVAAAAEEAHGFARPPGEQALARGDAPDDADDLEAEDLPARPTPSRAPVRIELGPRVFTAGRGVGAGGALELAFGAKVVGARLGATWVGGEGRGPAEDAVTAAHVEVTVDGRGRRTLGPVLGVGLLALRASGPTASGWGGAGTARVGLEWALPLEADVRATASLTGGVLGPRDAELAPLRAFALAGLGVAVGF